LVSSKKLLLVLLCAAPGTESKLSAQLAEVWSVALRPSALGREDGIAIDVDASGNVYSAGAAEQASPDDEAAFVILRHDPDGALLWARTVPLGRVARPVAIASHPLGGAVVAGEWEDDASDYRLATLRFDANGNEVWRAFFGGLDPGNGPESAGAVDLALDAAGNAHVTGWTDTGGELAIQFATLKYGLGGEELWARGFGGPGDDLPSAIAVDTAGRIHVAGTTAGPEDARFSVVRYDASGGELGAAHHDEVGQDFARALAVSPRGDAFIAGSTASPRGVEFLTAVLDLGGNLIWSARHGNFSTEGAIDIAVAADDTSWVLGKAINVVTGADYRLVRYDVGGNELWDARFEGDGDDGARGLAVDELGTAYVTGTSITPQGADVLTVAYDPEGNETWRTSSGGAGDQAASAIALGPDRGVHVVGSAAGPGVSDLIALRLDLDGDERWFDRWQLEGVGAPTDLALDGSGNVIVTGASTAAGRIDRLTVKLDPAGFFVWEARAPGDEEAGDLSVDAAGNVLLAGRSGLTRLRADGGIAWTIPQAFTRVALDPSGYAHAGGSIAGGAASDFLTAKYGEDGDEVWAMRYDASPRDVLAGLAIDSLSNVIVAGESGGAYATVKYDSAGGRVWDRAEPGGAPAALAVGPAGEVAVTGPVTVLYDAAGNRLWGSAAIQGTAAAIDAEGGVIVAGLVASDFAVTRFEPGGGTDWLTIRGEGAASGVPSDVALGAGGRIFVSGLVSDGAGGHVHALLAYDLEGETAGEALMAIADAAAPPPALAVDAAGDAYLAGGAGGAYVVGRFAAGAEPAFRRSESSGDGVLDLTDPVFTLNYLFSGGPPPACPDAADANDDGTLDITDAVFTLGFLFLGTAEPPSPGPFACGPDVAADDLGECSYGACP
jgi:hypothetical protein